MTSGRRRLLSVAKWIYVVLVGVFLASAIWNAGGQLPNWKEWLVEPAAYGFVVCWLLMATVLGFAWARVLSVYSGLRLGTAEWLPIQAAAWAGRYLPGKIGLMAGKLALLQRHDVEVKPLAFSVLFEQVAFVAAGGILVLLLGPPLDTFQVGWVQALHVVDTIWWRWSLAIVVMVAFFPFVHLAADRLHVTGRPGTWRAIALSGYYLFAHAVAGFGLYLILQVILADAAPSVTFAIGLLAAANVAGILAVFAPAGIGVREFVLVLGLSPFLFIEEALALAAILRLLTVIADIAFSAVAGGGTLLRVVRGRS